ncbi:hypothetical protein Tco_0665562 [Tanacetum coccineum]
MESNGIESRKQDASSKSGNDADVDNADIKPVYNEEPMAEEKVFAIAALKNKLIKSKGNSVDTKFVKPLVLGKLVLQPLRNQSFVRQPNAFKSERPRISKPWFASQVDVNFFLTKPVTQHYLPKRIESAFAKPDHVIAANLGIVLRTCQDLVTQEEARKKTQERDSNSKPSVMHTTSQQNTTNGSKQKPRSNNQISRSLPFTHGLLPFLGTKELTSPRVNGYLVKAHKNHLRCCEDMLLRRTICLMQRQRFLKKCLCSRQEVSFQDTQTDCVQDTAQRIKLKRLKASTAFKTRQTDAEQRRPTIKKLEVKQVEFKLGEDCWEIQVNRSTYC